MSKERIAIMTNFDSLNTAYSLVSIVKDQIKMFKRYDHEVFLFTNSVFDHKYDDGIEPITSMPFIHLKDYKSVAELTPEHGEIAIPAIKEAVKKIIEDFKIDIVLTHDLIFTGWNMPYALAIQEISKEMKEDKEWKKIGWFHWVHSVPNIVNQDGQATPRDWWIMQNFLANHKIVFPNKVDLQRVAEAWRTNIGAVRHVPHIKDLRTWYDFSEETCEIIDEYPGIMESQIVQIYPASTDRIEAKGLIQILAIFANFKLRGASVCLVVANQNAKDREELIKRYRTIANGYNLTKDEFIFTSEIKTEYQPGISKRILRELQLCSNIFIYPTHEESFGLVGPEAAHAGCFMVLNKSLNVIAEVFEHQGLYADFGSFHNHVNIVDPSKYYAELADIISARMMNNEALTTRTLCRLKFNMDTLYHKYYAPILMERVLWKT